MVKPGTSLIPSKDRMIREQRYHDNEAANLHNTFHLDEWASAADSALCDWHATEATKLRKVLDALYPGWSTE